MNVVPNQTATQQAMCSRVDQLHCLRMRLTGVNFLQLISGLVFGSAQDSVYVFSAFL